MRPPNAWPIAWWPRQTPRIGIRPAKRSITGTEMPASRGVQGPGEIDDPLRLPRLDLLQRDRVVAVDVDVGAQLAEVLDEVPGEAVVVVDHQQHVAPRQCVRLANGSAQIVRLAPEGLRLSAWRPAGGCGHGTGEVVRGGLAPPAAGATESDGCGNCCIRRRIVPSLRPRGAQRDRFRRPSAVIRAAWKHVRSRFCGFRRMPLERDRTARLQSAPWQGHRSRLDPGPGPPTERERT